MNKRTIICLFYLSTLPVLSFGQHINGQAERTPDALQLLEIQRGEVEFFKTLVYRFEVAWEESDLQSMIDIRSGLIKLMETEVKQLSEKLDPSKEDNNRLQSENDCLKRVKSDDISTSKGSMLGKSAEANKMAFNDFIRILEADFAAQSQAIRQPNKQ